MLDRIVAYLDQCESVRPPRGKDYLLLGFVTGAALATLLSAALFLGV